MAQKPVKHLCLLAILIATKVVTLAPRPLFTQPMTGISGTVVDQQSQKGLAEASVLVLGSNYGDATDAAGHYEIRNLPPGRYSIQVTIIGYEPQVRDNIVLRVGESHVLNFALATKPVELKEVVIQANAPWDKELTNASLAGVEQLRARDIKATPAAFDDVLRAIQVKIGVTSSGDYSGYYSVRGGNENQNLVIVDGAVIPNPYRFRAGFGSGFSDINPNTIENVRLYLGGYSAKYGGALSSILEVQSRIGNERRLALQGSINLVDLNGLVDGPLPGLKGSYLFSVRRTYYDWFANKFVGDDSSFPFFFELAGKVAFEAGPKNRFILSLKRSREGATIADDVSDQLNLSEGGKTSLASLTWRSRLSDKRRAETVVSYYNDQSDFEAFEVTEDGARVERQRLNSKAKHFSLKEDLQFKLAGHNWLNVGVQASFISAEVDYFTDGAEFLYARRDFPNNVNFDGSYSYYAAYLQHSARLSDRVHLSAGLRYDYSTLINSGNIAPRMNAWFGFNDATEFTAAWGIVYQYPDPLEINNRDPGVNLAINLQNLLAERATDYVFGAKRKITNSIHLNVNVYYKQLDRLLLPRDNETFFPLNNGIGLSRGVEIELVRKSSGRERFTGFVSYAFANAKFREVTAEQWLPLKFDRRHSLKLFTEVKLLGSWRANFLWQVATGLPFTNITGARTLPYGGWVYIRGRHNGANFSTYSRLDARLSYNYDQGRRQFSFYLDFLNLTNRRNVFDIIWEQETVIQEEQYLRLAKKRTFFMLPFVPSFGLSFKL